MLSTESVPLVHPETWHGELSTRAKSAVEWVWPGYLARGAVTLLTSQWKTGKTTLLSVLISKMARGGELAGLTVAPARVAVASEESLDCWQRRGERLGFGDGLCYFCQPFAGRPTLAAWEALVDRLAWLGRERGIEVVVIDPLAAVIPSGAENQTGMLLDVLAPLSRLTRQGQAVLVLHHPSKGAATAGRLARGCGALCASVDILMEMNLLSSALETDRRRRLDAWSRFDETPRRRLIELSEEGRDYHLILEPEQEDTFSRYWPAVERLLAFPPRKLTRQEMLTEWRSKATAPSPMTLWRVLDRAVANGHLLCEGSGERNDPFRYWLAVLPSEWETTDEVDYWPMVKHLLTCPPRKLSHYQMMQNWPRGVARPDPVRLEACLAQAVREHNLQHEGTGEHADPVRYFIAGLGGAWCPDPCEILGW
jgi:hypothetical protein